MSRNGSVREIDKRTRTAAVCILLLTPLTLLGCGGKGAPGPNGPSRSLSEEEVVRESLATWEVSSPETLDADIERLEIDVSRLGCANGETGDVTEVDVVAGEDQIAIRASVEPVYGSAYDCLGNNAVPITVDLGEPLGGRELTDGACEHERAAATRLCETSVRWPADGP